MNPTLALTIASLKMYYRNRQAIFWTLVLPLMFIVIFGLLNFGAFSTVNMGLVDEADTPASEILTELLERMEDSEGSDEGGVIDLSVGNRDAEMRALEDGDRHIVIVIPPDFGESRDPVTVEAFYAEDRFQQADVGIGIVRGILDEFTLRSAKVQRQFLVESQAVESKGLEYVDFLVPGIIAMAIMQMGIFSVVFSLIQYRQQGVLRRLYATPIRPHNFLIGQVFTRLLVSIVQVVVLLGVGVLIFDVTVAGNFGYLFILAVLGGALFLAIGFVISGFAKNEEVGAPLANIIALPMMFLSGVFFPTDTLPGVLEDIVQYLPLTFLADGMREVAIQGASITEIPWEVLGMVVWLAIAFLAATRVFRWE